MTTSTDRHEMNEFLASQRVALDYYKRVSLSPTANASLRASAAREARRLADMITRHETRASARKTD